MTHNDWQTIIYKIKAGLPHTAADLSDTYFGYSLWLQDESEYPEAAAITTRLYHLYNWVAKAKVAPTPCMLWTNQHEAYRWFVYKAYHPATSVIPWWLGIHFPDSDNGHVKESFGDYLYSSSFYVTYIDPWTALEQAAIDCPDFVTQILNHETLQNA